MSKLKAIIPVAGAGTRLRPFTYTQPKALIPIAGKPIISYIIDDLKSQGIKDLLFIVGYFGEKIVDYVKENYPDLNTEFVFQAKREGIGQAVFLVKEFIQPKDELIIVLGDSLIEITPDFYKAYKSSIAIKKVKDPYNFGVVELGADDHIVRFVEKPKIPKSNLALAGLYKIVETDLLFSILDKYEKDGIRTEGEFQLTDVLNEMLKQGVSFDLVTAEQWLDVGNGEVLLNSNALLLKKYGGFIAATAKIENSVIVEPVYIAENCELLNSIVGPNVSLGENSKIHHSIIENGIMGSYSKLDTMKLSEFVIGSDSTLKGASQTITVGDNTEIDFSK
ncbi:MAG: sugar phosphate nucleotidyltransferase [Chitinophagales bacterium]|jgi:glucose-1-phosphate thymidylyltransferase|nr:NTP transferase domain-containing protein [Sphingobacteriales bacterium]